MGLGVAGLAVLGLTGFLSCFSTCSWMAFGLIRME